MYYKSSRVSREKSNTRDTSLDDAPSVQRDKTNQNLTEKVRSFGNGFEDYSNIFMKI